MKNELAAPTPDQLQRSQRCMQLIVEAINDEAGSISFEQYMQICLYAEDVGYYASGDELFGSEGDFTTSAERSKYYAFAFALQVQKLQSEMPNFTIVEIGAGSGQFASDLLAFLKQRECLPNRYVIVETSEALRTRQEKKLSNSACETIWLQDIEEPINNAIVIANEVLDALPTKLVALKNNAVKERRVSLNSDGELDYVDRDPSEELEARARERIPQQVIQQDEYTYITEINLKLNEFVEKIASFVKQGIFFYVDYGYPRAEYYLQQRRMGTLICHFKHTVNDNPLVRPGLQDITASVDFTALAEAADYAGIEVDCYTTQAHFLLASNILENITQGDHNLSINEQAEFKRLLMPGEMGERFQVMVLNKNIDLSSQQFSDRDLLHRL